MADRKYTVDIGVQGADAAARGVQKVDGALAGMGKAAISAGAALFAGSGVIAGLTQINTLAQDAIRVNRMGTAFENLGQRAGLASNTLDRLRVATRGMVSDSELMRQANNAMLLGVAQNTAQMEEMTAIARRLGAAMGTDVATALESLTIGMGRQSRLWLDNLGIVVDTEQAYREFAMESGKLVTQLSEVEKKTAFVNETMETARELVQGLGNDAPALGDELVRLNTEWQNFKENLEVFIPIATVALGTFREFGNLFEFLLDPGASEWWIEYTAAVNQTADAIRGITEEERRLIGVREDSANAASDLVTATHSLADVQEAWGNAKAFQDAKAKKLADDQKKRDEDALAKEKELLEERMKGLPLFEEMQARKAIAAQQDTMWAEYKLAAVAAEVEAERQRTIDIMETRQELDDWLISEGERLFAADERQHKEDVRRAQDAVRLAKMRKDAVVDGVAGMLGAMGQLNSVARGNAELTKRLAQGEAIINTYQAANAALSNPPGPPFTIPLMLATIGMGLANVAQIEQQSFARGGVIEGAGGPTQDNIPVRASAGESILTAQATARLGRDGVDALNNGGGAGVTLVINGNLIGTESFVRDTLIPEIDRTLRKRLA